MALLAYPRPSDRKYSDRKPVRFWHMWSGEWGDVVQSIVDRYNESQTEYEVIALSIPSGASAKCLTGVAGGDPPDVMAQWEAVIPTWAEKGVIQPFDDLMSPEELARFKRLAYPGVRRMAEYKGKIYTLTPSMNLWACYANVKLLREAGLDPNRPPRTLEELAEWGKRLEQRKGSELTRMGVIYGSWRDLMPLFGGGLYDYKAGKLTLDSPQNIRALEFLVNDRNRLGFDNVVRFTSTFGPESGAQWSFLVDKIGIAVDGQWRVEQIRKVAPNFEYIVFPVPPPRGGRALAGFTNGNQMIIPSGAKQPYGALDFIAFWAGFRNPERGAEFVLAGGWLPMTQDVAQTPKYQAYLRAQPAFKTFVDLMPSENFEPMPPVTTQMYIQDRISKYQDLALRGTLTPAQAAHQLAKDVDTEIRRRQELGYD